MQETLSRELPDENASVAFGQRLGLAIKEPASAEGFVLSLDGDLGAGKTTLSRGILSAYGHSGAVKSPTYTLVEPYEFGRDRVYHFDLYRLGDPEELEYMGIRDYFGVGSLCLIEWPQRGEGFLPLADWCISIVTAGQGRRIEIKAASERGQLALASLSECSQ